MGCSSKAFKEPCALLISKNAVPLSPLCASSAPLSMHKMLSLSLKSLSLSSLSPPHGLPQRWRTVAGRWRPYLKCCWRRALSMISNLFLAWSSSFDMLKWLILPNENAGIPLSSSSPPSPPLPCCSASCTSSLSGDLGRFASSCCPSSHAYALASVKKS